MKKVLVTGGHMTPALAVMDVLKTRGWICVFLGRTHALEGDTAISQEEREVVSAGYEFAPLTTGRIQRKLTVRTIFSLLKIPFGLLNSYILLRKIRPQVILSFGGYLAVPVSIVGWFMRVPVVTLEQTLSPGLANLVISRFAKAVCIAWEDIQNVFPANKTFYTGNPLRKEIFQIGKNPLVPIHKPLLYITGGNLGAHSINIAVEKILEELLKEFTVIHQCGNAQEFNDYERLLQKKAKLDQLQTDRYYPFTYIGSQYIGWVLHKCQIIVTRAGANIVTEIIALKKAAIFIPLPWSGEGEQEKNARFLVAKSAARKISQQDLTPERLYEEILLLYRDRFQVSQNVNKLHDLIIRNASDKVANVVESVM